MLHNTVIFPPPGAQDVRFFDYCSTLERVLVVLVDGTICVYQVDLHSNNTFLER